MLIKSSILILVALLGFLGWVYLVPHLFSTQAYFKKGDEDVINITRKRHIIPREFWYQGGWNPLLFWQYATDPNYRKTGISSHSFRDETGVQQHADVQGFSVNPTFSILANREEFMAIRTAEEVYEFPTRGLVYSPSGSSWSVRFIGQTDNKLIYFYPTANERLGYYQHAEKDPWRVLIVIDLPFTDGGVKIVPDGDEWDAVMMNLKALPYDQGVFEGLCSQKSNASRRFAKELFGKEC